MSYIVGTSSRESPRKGNYIDIVIERRQYFYGNHFWFSYIDVICTAWKVSVFGDILVCIFPYSDWVVSLRIQSKCWKIRTRITPNTDPFYAEMPKWWDWISTCYFNIITGLVLIFLLFSNIQESVHLSTNIVFR